MGYNEEETQHKRSTKVISKMTEKGDSRITTAPGIEGNC